MSVIHQHWKHFRTGAPSSVLNVTTAASKCETVSKIPGRIYFGKSALLVSNFLCIFFCSLYTTYWANDFSRFPLTQWQPAWIETSNSSSRTIILSGLHDFICVLEISFKKYIINNKDFHWEDITFDTYKSSYVHLRIYCFTYVWFC